MAQLPAGFEVESASPSAQQPQQSAGLPAGFEVESQQPQAIQQITQGSAQKQAEPGLSDKFFDLFTGELRQTEAIKDLPEVISLDLGSSLDNLKLKSALAITPNAEEKIALIKNNLPETIFTTDEKGSVIATFKDGQKGVIDAPGVSLAGFGETLLEMAAFVPAVLGVGKFTKQRAAAGLPTSTTQKTGVGALGAGLTQTAIEGAQTAAGGTFDKGAIALSTVAGGVAEVAGPIIKSFRKSGGAPITEDVIKTQKEFTRKGFKSPYAGLSGEDKQKQLIKAITSGDEKKIAAMIDADPEFALAAQELGLVEKGLPSAASKDIMYRETEQALKKMPGSELSKTESDAIIELQQKADDLIEEFGGRIDKSELSIDLADRSKQSIDDLDSITTAAYDDIDAAIPRATMSKMDNTGEAMRQELADLGGDIDQLSALEKRLLKMSESDKVTYHAIDKIRKEVGETLGKKSDKFKSESSGSLKRIYGLLTEDQEVTAINKGMGEQWKAAKALVTQRKELEDNAIQMFGKNLSDAFMPKIGIAVKKMTTGDYKKFNELIKSVPPSQRGEVVVSALNDAFTMGSRKEKQLSIAGYSDWLNGLNKNKAAKAIIYKHLPEGMPKKLEALGRVANGIREAQASAPIGGQVMAAKNVFDKVTNGIARTVFAKFPGMIGDLVEVGLQKSKTKGFDKAVDVLSDPDFINSISALAAGQARKAATLEAKLMKKKKMQEFISTLPIEEAKAISKAGLIAWLSSESQNKIQESK